MSAIPSEIECDVLVIGAGPAGSAAAACLAEAGRDVVVLEREHFPRYHVGESLIPHCWYPLERLGIAGKLDGEEFVVPKHSVQFVSVEGVLSRPFYFFEHTEHESARTWQVKRAEFDLLLMENAVEKGARVFQGAAARELLWEKGSVSGARARMESGAAQAIRSRVVIDASGRDAFAQARHRWRVPDKMLKKVAIWTYYRGAGRGEGIDQGATTIAYLPEKGWFWYLPLADDVVSVGVVAEPDYLYRETRDPREIFEREVRTQPWIHARVQVGECIDEVRVTSEFSYRSKHCATDGLILTGDAFAFLDPVFSSGVYLALQGGVMAADAVEDALAAGDVSAERFRKYGEDYRRGIESMRRLVHAFYDANFNFGEFLKAHPDYREDLTDCLIGNLFRDFEGFFGAMSGYADIPGPLPHGEPLAST